MGRFKKRHLGEIEIVIQHPGLEYVNDSQHSFGYKSEQASGLDLHLNLIGFLDDMVTVSENAMYEGDPNKRTIGQSQMLTSNLLPTGISVAIPEGFEGQIRPRSSSTGRGIIMPTGTIDSDYRGELKIAIIWPWKETLILRNGERLAQLVIVPVSHVDLKLVPYLPITERGKGGFGSTGR